MSETRVVSLAPPPAVPRTTFSTDGIEKVLVVVAFVIFLGTFKTLLAGGSDERTDGSALFQAVTSAIYLASMVLVLARGFPTWGVTMLRRGWPLVLLTLLTIISTLWSEDPGTTFRRSIALILSMWFAFYIVLRFDPRTFFNLLVTAFGILLVVSILSAAIPGQGVTGGGAYSGAWRGLTGNKNELGRVIALAVALLPAAAVLRLTDRRRAAMIIGVVALPVLFLTHSATSLMAAVLGLGVGGVLYVLCGGRIGRFRLRVELRVLLGVIAVVSGLTLFTVAWTPLLLALGRDPTLTGRTKLWDWALTVNQDHRLLGSGYRSFWIDQNTRYFFVTFAWNKDSEGARSDSFSGPTHAHSGYVDLMLELGYVGLSVFILTVLSGLVNVQRTVRSGNLELGFIFAVILAFLSVYAITARSILQQAEGLWVLFAIFYLFSIKETLFLQSKFKRSD